MNLSNLVARWQKKMTQCSHDQAIAYEECIRDMNMMMTGELRPPYTLESKSPFKRHNGKTIKEAIEQEGEGSTFFDWARETHNWFQMDLDAHNYWCEVQQPNKQKEYIDRISNTEQYNDIKD